MTKNTTTNNYRIPADQLQNSSDSQLLSAVRYLGDHPEVRTDKPAA